MGRGVREALAVIAEKVRRVFALRSDLIWWMAIEQVGGLTPEKAQDYVKKMQSDGRYIQELWS